MFRINVRFVILLLFSFALAFTEGGPLFYRFFYSVVAILLLSIIVIVINRRNLNLDIFFNSNRYSAGDSVSFSIVLKNKSWIPVHYLIVNNSSLKKLSPRYNGDVVYIGGKKSKKLKYEVRFRVRGKYDFGSSELSFRDTASIIRSNKVYKSKAVIQVYPKIVSIPSDLFKGVNLFNNYKVSSSGIEDPYVIKDNRKYREGDNLNRINWKISAKYNELYVKNNEVFVGEEFNVFLDMNSTNYQYDLQGITEEKLIDFSASLIFDLIKKKIVSKLYINGEKSKVFLIKDNNDFSKLMDYFVDKKSDSNESFVNYLKGCKAEIRALNNIAFITSRVNDELCEFLLELELRKKNLFAFCNKIGSEDEENIIKLTKLGIKVFDISKFV